MKLHQTILMAILLITGRSIGETATFIFKNGSVEFGEFRRMTGDSVFLEKTGNGTLRENTVISKQSLSEVVFDSGNKLNLALSEYPPTASGEVVKSVTPPVTVQAMPAAAASVSSPGAYIIPSSGLRSPFVYGGVSALVPGLGQLLQGRQGKGALCLGAVGISVLGTMLAWNYTTRAYNNLQNNRSAAGFYRDADFNTFTFRLHGSQILTGISALLYLLNIADATAEAFAYNNHPIAVQSGVTLSSTGAGCSVAFAF